MTIRSSVLVAGVASMILASPVGASGHGHAAPHGQPEKQAAAEAAHPVAHAPGTHWTYEGESGPENWGDLSDDFKLCKTGHMQSPIDLGGADITGKFTVKAAYKPGALTILNNGHTVQVTIPDGSMLTSGISRYKLLQVHFHTPSEETIYSIHYPMVAHFVHVDYAGNLAVLGVLFEEGAANPELEKIIKAAPHGVEAAHPVAGVTFDPSKLLPANLAVFRYEGSLTTPPCTEGVHWHVATHPVTASAAQIAQLNAVFGDNARPTQPIYGRLLVRGAD